MYVFPDSLVCYAPDTAANGTVADGYVQIEVGKWKGSEQDQQWFPMNDDFGRWKVVAVVIVRESVVTGHFRSVQFFIDKVRTADPIDWPEQSDRGRYRPIQTTMNAIPFEQVAFSDHFNNQLKTFGKMWYNPSDKSFVLAVIKNISFVVTKLTGWKTSRSGYISG
jgi:hypothetical protein